MISSTFTYRSARSGSLTFGVILVLAVETMVFHLWLSPRFPMTAWAFTLGMLLTFWWLVADYRAMGIGAIHVGSEAIELPIGKRFTAQIQRDDILSADVATWRDLVDLPRDAVNLTKPAEPNVLLLLRGPTAVRLFGRVSRRVSRVVLHLDEPLAFVQALGQPTA